MLDLEETFLKTYYKYVLKNKENIVKELVREQVGNTSREMQTIKQESKGNFKTENYYKRDEINSLKVLDR